MAETVREAIYNTFTRMFIIYHANIYVYIYNARKYIGLACLLMKFD